MPRKTIKTTTKAVSDNPKNILGNARVSLTLVPPIALLHCADAMTDGADKYDPYNWRAKAVGIRGFCDAMKRHIDAYMEGEECATDSGAKHLGHVMAGAAILIDAGAHGALVDDRLSEDQGSVYEAQRSIVEANVKRRRDQRGK